jgi:hypothetical protein
MDEDEWGDTIDLWMMSESRHVNQPRITLEMIRENICLDCELPYQMEQMMKGNCFPIDPSKTPLARRGQEDEEE